MCVCVCMCVCIYIYIYVCVCVCVCACVPMVLRQQPNWLFFYLKKIKISWSPEILASQRTLP